jgi:ABC-type transport system involved in multi-copper enzyme maturation permease subunit
MKGLVLKDFINLKKNIKIFGALSVFYIFLSLAMDNSSYFGTMFTFVFAMLTLSTYSFDEQAKWDSYALTMPVTREQVVRSKYVIMLLLTVTSMVFSFGVLLLLNLVMKSENLYTGILASALGAAVVLIFYCITIPFITKLGVEKSRFILVAIYMIPFFAGSMIFKAVRERYPEPPQSLIRIGKFLVEYAYLLIPVVILIALLISYSVSVGIYRKKEF